MINKEVNYGYSQVLTAMKDIFKFWKVLIIAVLTLIVVSLFEIYFPNFMRNIINSYIGGRIEKINGESVIVYHIKNDFQKELFEKNGIEIIELDGEEFTKYADLQKLPENVRKEIRSYDIKTIREKVITILYILVFYIIIYFIHYYSVNYIGQGVMFNLRKKIFSHLLNFKMSYYINIPAGVLVTRVINDVEAINQFFSGVVLTWMKDITLFAGIIFMMYRINSRMFFSLTFVFPLLVICMIFFQKRLRDAYRNIRKKVSHINAFLSENFSGMYVVKSFVREKKQKVKFDKINNELNQAFERQVILSALFMPTINILRFGTIGFVVIYGGHLILNGEMLFGDIVAFFAYIELFFKPIRDLAEKFNVLQSAQAALERVFKILNDKENLEQTYGEDELIFDKSIEFKNVCFEYKENEPVLKNVSFKVKKGEKVAFVGHTGAGKTTIINLITGFYKIKSGDILIDGKSIYDYNVHSLRENLAYVPQDVFIFSDTVKYNICFNGENSDKYLDNISKELELEYFLSKLEKGYDTVMQERGNSLSYGEKQLIAFARSLYFDPKIIVLDEATSNIDSNTEHLIQLAMEKLMAGRTALIIAHRLSTIKHCEKIIVLNRGEIVEEGSHDELLKNSGYYSKLYKLQYE